MGQLDYQRMVIGYHGTDAKLVDDVLLGDQQLEYSRNSHDWLGKGIYFWEHGPTRAMEWAVWRAKHGGPGAKITKPAVIGAFINLGNCFDLLDVRNTTMLGNLFPIYKESCEQEGFELPQNKPSYENDIDSTKRFLDCAVLNWVLELKEKEDGVQFDSVRCLFSEGKPAFDGSLIMAKSHIQIAVREPLTIVGYFKPNIDFGG